MRPFRCFFTLFLLLALFALPLAALAIGQELLPVMATAVEGNLHAEAALLMDVGTREILLSKNADDQLPIASVTKVMTMLLVLEALETGQVQLEEPVLISAHACSYGGAQIYLEPGEQFKVEELLMAVSIKSANDAAVALAEHVAGSESAFVAAMNQRASELGMQNSHFINACGLDNISVTGNRDDKGYSSARDVALMSVAVLKYQELLKGWLTTRITYLERAKGPIELFNTNHLFIKDYSGGDGLKTGFTNAAKWCLTATAERDGFRLVAVALGVANDKLRLADVQQMLNFGFANYVGKTVAVAGSYITDTYVNRGQEKQVRLITQDKLAILLPKGDDLDAVKEEIELETNVFAPVEAGQTLGLLKLVKDDIVLAEVDLIAAHDVSKRGLGTNLLRLVLEWLNL